MAEQIQFTADEAAQIVADANKQPAQQTTPSKEQSTQTPPEPKQEQQQPQRPEWLPEKFWKDGKADYEGLAKSYAEKERQTSGPKPTDQKAEGDPKPGEQQPEPQAKPEEAFKPFFEEFSKQGKLSDESYKALEGKGLSRDVVDTYIRGQEALRAREAASIYEAVGGEQAYQEVAKWAGANLPQPEIDAFNRVLEGGDVAAIKLAVQGLNATFQNATGKSGQRFRGTSNGTPVVAFESTAQVTEAMSDPRYKTDPAYRASVERRIAASNVL